jgi:hypothetical protein
MRATAWVFSCGYPVTLTQTRLQRLPRGDSRRRLRPASSVSPSESSSWLRSGSSKPGQIKTADIRRSIQDLYDSLDPERGIVKRSPASPKRLEGKRSSPKKSAASSSPLYLEVLGRLDGDSPTTWADRNRESVSVYNSSTNGHQPLYTKKYAPPTSSGVSPRKKGPSAHDSKTTRRFLSVQPSPDISTSEPASQHSAWLSPDKRWEASPGAFTIDTTSQSPDHVNPLPMKRSASASLYRDRASESLLSAQSECLSAHNCICGNVYMDDSRFCRKCGEPRYGKEPYRGSNRSTGSQLRREQATQRRKMMEKETWNDGVFD